MMKCERCECEMVEEELVVVGGLVRVKGCSAWHCPQCGRLEYEHSTALHRPAPLQKAA